MILRNQSLNGSGEGPCRHQESRGEHHIYFSGPSDSQTKVMLMLTLDTNSEQSQLTRLVRDNRLCMGPDYRMHASNAHLDNGQSLAQSFLTSVGQRHERDRHGIIVEQIWRIALFFAVVCLLFEMD